MRATGDCEFVRDELYAVLADIIDWHERGTRYGIRVDDDGLLLRRRAGVQLTWMDAKVGDWVVTPRHGKPVEIQALWYNALRVMAELAPDRRRRASYRELADRARASFQPLFWNEAAGCLYDVVDGERATPPSGRTRSSRSACSTRCCRRTRRSGVVDVVERHLLTPYGLRTLAPSPTRSIAAAIEGGPVEPRRRLSSGHGLAVADRPVRHGVEGSERRRGAAAVDRRTSALYAGRRRRADSGSLRWRRAAPARRVHCAGVERGGGVTSFRVILVLLAAMLSDFLWSAQPQHARQAMVVSGDPIATDTGLAVLKAGGNAMDAATAMAFALGVTHSGMSGLGGGGHVLVRMHDGRTAFFDFREQAPGKASRGMFLDGHGNLSPGCGDGMAGGGGSRIREGLGGGASAVQVEAVEGTVAARDSTGARKGSQFPGCTPTCSAAAQNLAHDPESTRVFLNAGASSGGGQTGCSPNWRGRWNAWPTAARRSSTKARLRTASPKPWRRTADDHAGRFEGVHGSRSKPLTGAYRAYEILTAAGSQFGRRGTAADAGRAGGHGVREVRRGIGRRDSLHGGGHAALFRGSAVTRSAIRHSCTSHMTSCCQGAHRAAAHIDRSAARYAAAIRFGRASSKAARAATPLTSQYLMRRQCRGRNGHFEQRVRQRRDCARSRVSAEQQYG